MTLQYKFLIKLINLCKMHYRCKTKLLLLVILFYIFIIIIIIIIKLDIFIWYFKEKITVKC